jgi:hypothetical protein
MLRHMLPRTVFDFDEPPISGRCSLSAALIAALTIMIYSYMDNWNHFYGVSYNTDGLVIHYLFPERTKYIMNVNKIKINTINEVRRGYRITIRDDGHTYSSQVMDRQQITQHLTVSTGISHMFLSAQLRTRR